MPKKKHSTPSQPVTQKLPITYIVRGADGQERVYYALEPSKSYLTEAKKRFEKDTNTLVTRIRWIPTKNYKGKMIPQALAPHLKLAPPQSGEE